MKNWKNKATALAKNTAGIVKEKGRKVVLGAMAAVAVLGAMAPGNARADVNAGVAEVSSAITALKPDMSTIVVAAIGLCLVGIGASVALGLGKRLIGK